MNIFCQIRPSQSLLKCCRSKDGFEFTPNGLDTRYHSAEAKDTEIGPLSFVVCKRIFLRHPIGKPGSAMEEAVRRRVIQGPVSRRIVHFANVNRLVKIDEWFRNGNRRNLLIWERLMPNPSCDQIFDVKAALLKWCKRSIKHGSWIRYLWGVIHSEKLTARKWLIENGKANRGTDLLSLESSNIQIKTTTDHDLFYLK